MIFKCRFARLGGVTRKAGEEREDEDDDDR